MILGRHTLALFILLAPALASAQWASMDRGDGTIKANLSSTVIAYEPFIDAPAPDGGTDTNVFLWNDLYLQGTYKGLGGYLLIPYASSTNGAVANNAIADIEIGALWDVPLPMLNFTLRAGVGAPVASSEEYLQQTLGFAGWARLADRALTYPDVVSTRFSGSVRLPMGILAARADVGLDLLIPIGEGSDASDFNTLFRFNLGAAFHWKGFGATFEYGVTTEVVDSKVRFDDDTGFTHAIVFSVRAETKYIDIYLAGTVALNSDTIGKLGGATLGFTSKWGMVNDDFVPVTEFFE